MLNTMPMALGAPKPPQNLCGRYVASSNRISMAPRSAAKRDKSLAMIFLFLACVSLIFERRDGGFKALTLSFSTFLRFAFFVVYVWGNLPSLPPASWVFHRHIALRKWCGFCNHSFVSHLEVHNFQLERFWRVLCSFFSGYQESNARYPKIISD